MPIRTGFIGLGNQGFPIARNLLGANFTLCVHDIARAPVDALIAAGAHGAGSPREVAQQADLIGICVPEDRHVSEVMLGPDGVLAGARPGTVVAIHSTVLPDTVTALAHEAALRDVELLDACVTGGAARAAQRMLVYLVGGSAAALEHARPMLEASSRKIIHAGVLGNGARLKLCINLITYIQWAAAFESFTLAQAVGLPREVLEEAGLANGQITPLMQAFLGMHAQSEASRHGDAMQAQLRSFMQVGEKDLAWALQLARQAGVALPVGGLVAQLLARIYGVDDPQRR